MPLRISEVIMKKTLQRRRKMRKVIMFFVFILSGLLVISSTGITLQAAIPASERAALIELYNSTNGDNWTNNSGWKTPPLDTDGFAMPGTEGTWYGIFLSGDHVTEVYLAYNQLIGEIPRELENLSNLTDLELRQNQLSGSIPPELGKLSDLKFLELGENQLSGSIPPELGNLSNLTDLGLAENQLSGSIPPELGNLSDLKFLDLDENQISGSIPPALGNLSNLESLDLYENQLSGSIPPELGNLSNLQWELNLNMNQLSGDIPKELGDLSDLVYLGLYSNQLSGSIPPELGNLSNLEFLLLGSNQLSGNIPPELGNLSKLEALVLDSNQLSGSIPSELGELTSLEVLWLNSNQLSGNIPSSLKNLTNLLYEYEGVAIGYNALYTTDDSLRNFLNSKDPDWEDTQTIAPSNVSATPTSTSSIRVSWTPITYTGDTGGYNVYQSTTSGGPWIYSGITADKSTTSYDVTGLSAGTTYYFVVKTQTHSHSNNENTVVSEHSEEISATTTSLLEEKDPPFGSFETPIDGSTVASSIPVTGWALDDTGIDNVKIYRMQGNGMVYIGDALLVEGARPDVAAAYPQYPNNTRAGWGYMMLSNFLPNSGNGTFVLYAIATDLVGKTTTLGTKTIICDNANAVKPFGAIDTPTQGGTASGSNFRNHGWILTPMPNSMPTDGSTISVYVDGVDLGHPIYNVYRSDIAELFPGYANSDGAHAYFDFDTTIYTNGVHTIAWNAVDDAGNTDGIGSRFFTISNTGSTDSGEQTYKYTEKPQTGVQNVRRIIDLPVDCSVSVRVKKDFRKDIEPRVVHADEKGIIRITIREVEWLQIDLTDRVNVNSTPKSHSSNYFSGYLAVSNRLYPLPIGSTLDTQRGIFYWQPGPGFIGEYHFIFIEVGEDEIMSKKDIIIKIVPKKTIK
jgi:Leucine-rich repeat (LRR) protein